MKIIEYDGNYYEVEDWVKYVVRHDISRNIYGYENEPKEGFHRGDQEWYTPKGGKVCIVHKFICKPLFYGLKEV